ncbi:MAG: SPASM domain-containing protein, partial [Rhodospirillales bacterium]|nr:SPASM domain-containing protein [Rhodospirillales bacterium]
DRLHDRFRVDKKNAPTFDTVAATAEKLRDGGVEFNTLTTIHRRNVKFGGEVYRFLRDLGVTFMQFIPIVERKMPEGELAGPPDGGVLDEAAALTEWSVPADGYGDFMCDVFDVWVKRDVGEVFVQMFDVHLGAWLEEPPGLCVNAKTCGQNMVLEHNGDLYACDHFVYDSYRLGNITETPLVELANSAPQQKFGEDKFDQLPGECRGCWFLSACFGGCPKHRFVRTSDDEPGLNYLCPSYKKFAAHTEPVMSQMAELLRRRQPASRIMDILGQQKAGGNKSTPSRNDSCPCGSGKKYKKCCG